MAVDRPVTMPELMRRPLLPGRGDSPCCQIVARMTCDLGVWDSTPSGGRLRLATIPQCLSLNFNWIFNIFILLLVRIENSQNTKNYKIFRS